MKPSALFMIVALMICFGCGEQNTDPIAKIKDSEAPFITYQKQKQTLDPFERYDLVLSLLKTSNDEDVLIKVMEDALDLVDVTNQIPNGGTRDGEKALNATKIAEALPELLESMRALQQRFKPESTVYQEAYYGEIYLLLLSNRIDAAIDQYKEAKKNRWTSVEDNFAETIVKKQGFVDGTATLYNIMIDDTYTDPQSRNFVDTLLSPMYMHARRPPGIISGSASNTVYSHLDESSEHPEFDTIAKALCLIVDNKIDQAMSLLIDLEQSLQTRIEKGETIQEYANIPVYHAAAAYLGNRPANELRLYLQEFVDRNPSNLTHVIHTCSALVRWRASLEGSYEITGFFNDAGFFSDPIIMQKIDPHELAHMMDLHLQRVWYSNDYSAEMQDLAERIVSNYFPETRGGASALGILARIHSHKGEMDKAADCWIRTMLECPYDMWVKQAENQLLGYWIRTETSMDSAINRVRGILQMPNQSQKQKLAELEAKIKELYER